MKLRRDKKTTSKPGYWDFDQNRKKYQIWNPEMGILSEVEESPQGKMNFYSTAFPGSGFIVQR